MRFHLDFKIPPLSPQASYDQKCLMMGSCFSEQIGDRLKEVKFNTLVNPHGILYNPISMVDALETYLTARSYTPEDLFQDRGIWHSWDHHGRFSHSDRKETLDRITESQNEAVSWLKEADWLILTLGSAWTYRLKSQNRVVANCHQVPAETFTRGLLRPEQIIARVGNFLYRLAAYNAKVRVIFTVSPVRHSREGIVENNLSKSILLYAVHHLVNKFEGTCYFPAYELVIDDLRDYRFFEQDLVHPNRQAVDYVWDRFVSFFLTPSSQAILAEISEINRSVAHRPLHAESEEFARFKGTLLEKIRQLEDRYGFLNFSAEKKRMIQGEVSH
jgi:hypothetical protein